MSKNNDTISRQAAIDVLEIFTQTDALGHTPKQIVEALPSAQPELSDEEKRLIKQLRSYHNGAYAKVIDKLVASAQPMRWIPCSERMPELPFEEHGIDHDAYKVGDTVVDDWYESEYVLCTNTDLCIAVGKVCRHVTTSPDGKELENRVLFEPASKYDGFIDIEEIIAWMPMPEPWRGDAE